MLTFMLNICMGFTNYKEKNELVKLGCVIALYASEHLSVARKYEFEMPDLVVMCIQLK